MNNDFFFLKVFQDITIAKKFLEDYYQKEIAQLKLIGLGTNENYFTINNTNTSHRYYCAFEHETIVVEIQQWHKQKKEKDRLIDYISSGLRILPGIGPFSSSRKSDYLIIWSTDDDFEIEEKSTSYNCLPSIITDFILDNELFERKDKDEIIARHNKVKEELENLSSKIKSIQNERFVFLYQKNIVNKPQEDADQNKCKKYAQWFEFAELSQKENNTKEDFAKFADDEIFSEIIKILCVDNLSEEEKQILRTDENKQT